MADGKKTFIFYSDWINMVREMPNEDAGALLKHVLSYVNDEDPITDNVFVKMAFGHMKPMLKRDLDNWEKQLERYSKMGKKSAEKRALNIEQPTLTYVEHTSTVNDNVNVNTITTTKEAEVDFNLIDLWIVNLKNETIYLEGLYRLYKLKEGSISKIILKFKEHLKIYPKQHVDISDFKKHFASWVRLKINNKELTEFCKHQKGEL
jgi:hypothetical protein